MVRWFAFFFYALVFRLIATFAHASGRDDRLPVTTSSEKAREHFERGRTAAFHYSFQKAVQHLDRAIDADPDFPLVYIYRGGSTYWDQDERREYFDRAFALKDRASEGERRMIEAFSAFLLHGEHEKAAEIFRELTQEYPGDPHIPAHLGLRYVHALDRYEEAVDNFRLAVKRDPDWAPTRNWLGYALLKVGRAGEAEEVFQNNLERHPDDHFTHNFIGEVFLTAGRTDEAKALFERALELDPTFNAARVNLARVGVETGKSQLEQALLGRGADAVADVLTKDVQLLSGGEEIIQGRDVVKQRWEDIFPSPVNRVDLETVEVFTGMDGATATEVGRYDLGGEEGTDHVGRYVAVWKQTDAGWKLHRVMWAKLRGVA